MKNLFWGTLCMFLMVACEQQDVNEMNVTSDDVLRVEAEISSETQTSRTQTQDGKVTFSENDVIGFYTPETETSGSWKYVDGDWVSEDAYSWPDKVTSYDYCAYYPFVKAEKRDAITMPDLSAQKGLASELGKFDFLVARCSASYDTNKGTVAFTGEQAFKHVYALLSVTLKVNADTDGSALNAISLKADNLMTTYTYHFAEEAEEDGVTVAGVKVDELALTELDATIPSHGYHQVFVVNPLASTEAVNLSIEYSRGEEKYKAATDIPLTALQEGTLHKLNVVIKKTGLVVEGNTVEDWTVENLDDVFVEETPAE